MWSRTVATALALVTGLAAPAAGQEAGPPVPAVAGAASLPPPTAAAIREAVADEMSRLGIPGLSLAVAQGDFVRFEEGFGFSDVENSVPARPETVYRLASLSKPLTAAAVLRLSESGRLDLDAPVTRYCPEFPEKAWPVTSRQLLCHQGGVRGYRPGEQPMTRRFTSLLEGLALFRDDPLEFEPGTKVLYSTYGYTVLGCAAVGAAARPFLPLLEESVFAPAGMTATGADDVRALVPSRAQGYVRGRDGQLLNSALADMSYKVPGGGMAGTAPDAARFGAALLAGRILSPATLERMLARQKTREGRLTSHALGLSAGTRAGRREAWHTGGQERVSNVLYLVPESGLAVAILANLEGVQPRVLDLARRVADLVTATPRAR